MARRRREADKKRPSNKKKTAVEPSQIVRSYSEGSQVAGPSRTTRGGASGATPMLASVSLADAQSSPWNVMATREEVYRFESPLVFENALNDPRRTSTAMAATVIEIENARHRDEDLLSRLTAYTEARRVLFDTLLERAQGEREAAMEEERLARQSSRKGKLGAVEDSEEGDSSVDDLAT